MIDWISSWAKGITLAVIIATIVEMIIPENNNKKYIKMVIGVYILFSIVSPIITAIKGNNYEFDISKYENYFENTYKVSSNVIESNNEESIEDIYIENLKKDITQKLKNKGYIVHNLSIEIKTDEENYGDLKKILLIIEEGDLNNINDISINKIEINNNTSNTSKKQILNASQIKEIKDYLVDTYNISKNNIEIN